MNRQQRRNYLFDFAKQKIDYKNKFYKIKTRINDKKTYIFSFIILNDYSKKK